MLRSELVPFTTDSRRTSRGISGSLVWVLPDLGFYHHSRIRAVGESGATVHVVDTTDVAGFNEFGGVGPDPRYSRHTLFPGRPYRSIQRDEMEARLRETLSAVAPTVVCVNGWSDRSALLATLWARENGVPVVVCSETSRDDEWRSPWKEWIKSRVISHFSAALVGGRTHAEYLGGLGMPRERVFLGYDVVDNEHFANGAARARAHESSTRRALGLPPAFFLASARFVPKKNLPRLLDAYAIYRQHARDDVRHLVLLGDGEMRPELERLAERLQLEGMLHMPGFASYETLPMYYGLADAFVHASTSEQWGLVVNEAMAAGLPVVVSSACGCADELVLHGQNGFRFTPTNTLELAECLRRIAENDKDRVELGLESQRIIGHWAPERFAQGLLSAAYAAMRAGPGKVSYLDRAVLRLVSSRS